MIDITERRNLEEQVLRTQRLESVGTLAGGLAHDLNNLLAPILLSTDILREIVDTDDARSLLDTVQSSAERGAQLIRRLLGFARGVKGERRSVDLRVLGQELEQVIRETFPRNIELSLTAASDLWPIHADPSQVHQVLMNLLVNARDAMPRGGRLEVSLEDLLVDEVFAGMYVDAKAGPHVLITVTDNGVGMSAETQARIFEPFFSTKGTREGTGLGLSTVFSIVRGHGGFLHVSSQIGQGTNFEIYLPAAPGEASVSKVEESQSALPRGRGELILLVDDEPEIRTVAGKALERYGYRVAMAENGADATRSTFWSRTWACRG